MAATTSCLPGVIGRISGAYVFHRPNDVAMLQITEADNGQLTGTFSDVAVKAGGRIESIQKPFTGVFDRPQITLTFGDLFGHQNVSGIVSLNAVELQIVNATGTVEAWRFERSSAAEFNEYAGVVRRSGNTVAANAALVRAAGGYSQAINAASSWMTSSNLHVSKIPAIEQNYRRIESQMESIIQRQRVTANGVDRSQLAVAVNQGDVAGSQFDIQVEQVWNGIMRGGNSLFSVLSRDSADCRISDADIRSKGASPETLAAWRASCNQVLSAKAKFDSGFKYIAERYGEVKQIEAEATRHRQALVSQANRLR